MSTPAATLPRDLAAIREGETARMTKVITTGDVEAFAALSGDYNPLHVDEAFARGTSFRKPVAHGMLLASYVSTLIGMHLPGPGALWTRQSFRWPAAAYAGDTIELTLRVTHKSEGAGALTVEVKAVNQNGKTVMEGEGSVILLERRERGQDRALSERVALVTGASRGIGAAIARALGDAGAAVAVNYLRGEAGATEVSREIAAGGGQAFPLRADIGNAAGIGEAVERVCREFGRPVDVLVNNACPPAPARPFLELRWDEVQELFDVQVRGAFLCCQAVLPGMLQSKSGRIINIGSVFATGVPPAHWSAYVMAKSALRGLTRSLAAEYGPHGVRVNMISPGMTETDSISAVPERLRKVQAMQTPLRRLGAAEDVARTAVFLCGPGGEYITGAEIPVCGGSSM